MYVSLGRVLLLFLPDNDIFDTFEFWNEVAENKVALWWDRCIPNELIHLIFDYLEAENEEVEMCYFMLYSYVINMGLTNSQIQEHIELISPNDVKVQVQA